MTATIHFVALGCPKNRVDTERMMGLAQRLGLELVAEADHADIIVVNTCGFILPAKEESVETVLELARHKKGRCRKLVMAGCLAQRYSEELAHELPEVDHFLGTTDLPRLAEILTSTRTDRLAVGEPVAFSEEDFARTLTGPPHSTYLKIAEGCDRPCAFCIIPRLRGAQRSRTVESLIVEAKTLVAAGARELNLIAQDTTAYGRDLSPATRLVDLLHALDDLDGIRWIRILYTYPSSVDLSLVETMQRLPRVAPYLDLPFQHVDDLVLRRMRRGYSGQHVRETLALLREKIPGIFLRGTLLCGHPGETEAAHRAMLDFVVEMELDHLGVFPFSVEEGTDAANQSDQVPPDQAQERAEELMELQRSISQKKLQSLIGHSLEVMVDGVSPESEFLLQGRHAGQAPEVDGVVILADCEAQPGELIRVRITDTSDYDLLASPRSDAEAAPN